LVDAFVVGFFEVADGAGDGCSDSGSGSNSGPDGAADPALNPAARFSSSGGDARDVGYPLMAGTRPAISTNGLTLAGHGANGNLWISGPSSGGGRDMGVAILAGTSSG
jgi:hypothetical protein